MAGEVASRAKVVCGDLCPSVIPLPHPNRVDEVVDSKVDVLTVEDFMLDVAGDFRAGCNVGRCPNLDTLVLCQESLSR